MFEKFNAENKTVFREINDRAGSIQKYYVSILN
jgi:hypothetical protein